MSHEIRTPMNAVIGFSELLLLEDDLKQENRDYVRTILSSGKNLLGIINDILDFSKVEAGHVELETVCFHLPNVMNDVIDTLEIAASEKNIELTLSIQVGVPVRVFGDPSRLRQVVINLVSNAIKFTPSGNVTISIDKDNASGLVHFAVSDTGIGMSQDQVNKVFEAFSQADTSTNRRFGGTGLGTTISKQIVELMQGSIWIESQLGEGSTFHFTAKLEEAVTYEQCLFETEEYVQIDYISPRIFNVLLAEDIAANASLVTLRLEQPGHTVTWVKNGKLAVEAVKNNNFDLILMDVQMPEMDGLNASKLIRTQFESSQYRIPIIALTASVMKEDQQQCFEAGMDTIESKPIDFSALLSKMESIVRKERGTPNKTLIPSISTSTNQVDFSVLDSIVDYKQGVNTWRDPDVFVNALISFAESHKDDGQKITALLTLSTPDLDGARKISHALKGLAGNLSIIDVINKSIELDELLKQKSIENAIEKSQELNTSLEQAALAISTLQLPSNEDNEPNKELDPIKVEALLDKIDSTLDELDPSAVMPYIEELSQYLDKAQLTEIEYFIDHFEFDSAKIEVQNLANRLGINKR